MKKDDFFERLSMWPLSVTYGDVRLEPGYSKVPPKDVDLNTMFSRNVSLRIPIVSAAMDTVTESRMAIAMAKAGGLGVIHRKLSLKEQAEEVTRVKFHLHAVISKPITVFGDETIGDIQKRQRRKKRSFQSFPVVNRERRLIGLLTRTDLEMCDDPSSKAVDVMTKNPVTAPAGTSLNEAYKIMKREKKKVLPLVNEDGTIAGMFVLSDIRRTLAGDSNGFNIDADGHLRVAAAIGTGEKAIERAKLLLESKVDVLVIDTAHAHSEKVHDTLREIKRLWSQAEVVVGNVATAEATERLIDLGADGIKVGIGPGSICTTRIVSGAGVPQVTAIYNCVRAAEGSGVPVCADGGIRKSGDITVAIATGANSSMLGNLLAGTEETPGEIIVKRGVQYKRYDGMGSHRAMRESEESRDRYQQREIGGDKLVPEGEASIVPFKGPVEKHLFRYTGGLRAGMGYVGAATIEELRTKAKFHHYSESAVIESHPHDVIVVEDSVDEERGGHGVVD